MAKPSETIYKGWIKSKDKKCEACDTENKKRYSWKANTKTCLGAMTTGADAVRDREADTKC